MRLKYLVAAPIALLIPSSTAIFIDDAFRIDYQIPLVGFPQPDTTFFQQPFAESKASLIYTLSERSILAAVNPKDGELVWRQKLRGNGTESFVRGGEGQDIVVSGSGQEIAAWSAADGRLSWSASYGAQVLDVEILELQDSATTKGAKDAIVLTGGTIPAVRRLDGETGDAKWVYEDKSNDKPYQVLASATEIFYVSTHSSKLSSGLKIKVTILDSVTGQKTDQYSLSSDADFSDTSSILFAGANSAAPMVAWTDKAKKSFKFNILGDKKTHEYTIDTPTGEHITEISVHAPTRSNSVLRFLVHYATPTTHWASIYEIDLTKKAVASVKNVSKLNGKAAYAVSQINANLYFTKVTEREVIVLSAKGETIGRWAIESYGVPGLDEEKEQVHPVHATSEVVVRDGSASAVRVAVFLSTGDWVLLRNGEVSWYRPEALSGATAALWTDFEAAKDLAEQLETESHSNVVSAYIHRLTRHIGDLEHLPAWLQSLPVRVIQGVLGKESTVSEKDTFGFGKRIVFATASGRLIAIDSSKSGKAIWNTNLIGLEHPYDPNAVELTYDAPNKNVLVRVKGSDQQLIVGVANGLYLGTQPAGIIGDATQPESTVSYVLADGEVRGYMTLQTKDPVWRFIPAKGEHVISVTARPYDDPVASIGKVLGDRRVLYKYLNSNLALVTAVAEGPVTRVSLYLLDTVSGKVLHTQTHYNVDTTSPITAVISENWYAYSFTTGLAQSAKESEFHGHYLVVAELFESSIPNDRGPLGATANYSSLDLPEDVTPHVDSQTYQIPEQISSMTVTHTKQGITSRALLAVLSDANSIVAIPRVVIDPRRPVGREPNTNEQMEGLAKYAPVIEFDPKWYLNHKREVLGVKKVLTSPALLESTSLVVAYGLDVFGTRVTPSFSFDLLGKGFNKVQMLMTVAALWGTVMFVAPLVRRKMINTRWQT